MSQASLLIMGHLDSSFFLFEKIVDTNILSPGVISQNSGNWNGAALV